MKLSCWRCWRRWFDGARQIHLCGVELYEGVLKEEAEIRAFMQRACDVMRTLLKRKAFARVPALLSGAGSAWYDVVAEEFASAAFGDAVEIVLRPGCYLTHDVGNYETQQKRILASNPIAREMRFGTRAGAAYLGIHTVNSRSRTGGCDHGQARCGI